MNRKQEEFYVHIGNSDNRLTQREWSRFVGSVRAALESARQFVVIGEWFTVPDAPRQSACWCITAPDDHELQQRDVSRAVSRLQLRLSGIAGRYRQDAIAWARADVEMIRAFEED